MSAVILTMPPGEYFRIGLWPKTVRSVLTRWTQKVKGILGKLALVTPEIFIWGSIAQKSPGAEVPRGVWGEAAVGGFAQGSGTEVPQFGQGRNISRGT